MRAPPQPRKSRHRLMLQVLRKFHDTVGLQKVRSRWHLHKVHKVSRANSRVATCNKKGDGNKKKNGEIPLSPIRLEDIANQPSGIETPKKRRMPLLIASFPRGCAKSPMFNVLEKNKRSKLLLSRRKYKLKTFNGGNDVGAANGKTPRVHAVKREVIQHAQMKVNYHRKGVVNSTCVLVDSQSKRRPEYLTFGQAYSLRLNDYPSLSIRHPVNA
ncbi:AaceriAAL105Cp [[Ashbya] aceris (nom. inval.)]|nr:AaceriAAL105Cp [[Ashbya] aceris (nom. inval.)]